MIMQHLQHELLAFKARFSSVKGSPVLFLCLTMNEERRQETNCTAEYGQSFEKQSRSIKWPCLKWKLGCFILPKTHSYCKKKVIPAGVIVTTY